MKWYTTGNSEEMWKLFLYYFDVLKVHCEKMLKKVFTIKSRWADWKKKTQNFQIGVA